MHVISLILGLVHKLTLGLALIFANASNHSIPQPIAPAPSVLPPSGSIVLTSTTTLPLHLGILIPSPFKESTPVATSAPKSLARSFPTTSTSAAKPKPISKPAPVVTAQPATTTAPVPEETIPPSNLNAQTRAALVNVLCNVGGTGSLDPISGSGVIIDPSGVVLTNAHVGQFFLLRNYPTQNNVDCVLRTGSPARATYRAELLYFPLAWMQENAAKIIQQSPTGTGERDYALLYITGKTDGSPLPNTFPYLSPYTGDVFDIGDDTLLAGYAAGFIEGITIQTNLYVSSAFGKIEEVFTFHDGGSADLLSIPATIVSQKGASGGAAVRGSDGKLIGLIATATQAADTSNRDLRAITIAHIDRSLIEDTGHNLHYLLTNDPATTARIFNLTLAPTLTKMLLNVLNR